MENNAQEEIKEEELSIEQQLQAQQHALTEIYASVEKTRKIILWTGIANLALFVVPLIAALFLLPTIMNTFTSSLGGGIDEESKDNTSYQVPSLGDSLKNLNEILGN